MHAKGDPYLQVVYIGVEKKNLHTEADLEEGSVWESLEQANTVEALKSRDPWGAKKCP